MITLTPKAIAKVKEFIRGSGAGDYPVAYVGIFVGVQGGGCSGFSYLLRPVIEVDIDPDWNVIEQDGLKVYVDQMSAMYLEGVTLDYVEQLDGSGFKFNNPNVKSTCGCGSSFNV